MIRGQNLDGEKYIVFYSRSCGRSEIDGMKPKSYALFADRAINLKLLSAGLSLEIVLESIRRPIIEKFEKFCQCSAGIDGKVSQIAFERSEEHL